MKKFAIGLIYILGLTGCASESTVNQSESSAELNTQVNIYDIEDSSFYDDQETFAYYWGVNFTTDQEPSTKLNCRISAFNDKGEEILSVQQIYNVVNNGVAVIYGMGGMPTTTKSKFKEMDSFGAECTKAFNQ
jgi:hypothetical protein